MAEEMDLPIRYTIDIAAELKQLHMSLFHKPALLYFIVDDEFIKSEETLNIIKRASTNKRTIVGIIETIDKRSKFYKAVKSQIETIAMPKLSMVSEFKKLGITDGITIARTISMLKGLSNNNTIGKAEIFKYKEFFAPPAYQSSLGYTELMEKISSHDTGFLQDIKEKDFITLMYTMYYILTNKQDSENTRRCYLVGNLINEVISGKLCIANALQVLKLKY